MVDRRKLQGRQLIGWLSNESGWVTREVPRIELSEQSHCLHDAIDEINRLHDALQQCVDWIVECGSDYEARQFVLTEARAALSGLETVSD